MSLFGRLFDFNGDGHASEEEEIFGMAMMDDYERENNQQAGQYRPSWERCNDSENFCGGADSDWKTKSLHEFHHTSTMCQYV